MEGQCSCTNLQREGGTSRIVGITMKIWERIIDRRKREETSIREEQFGFMPGRGTTDAIFAGFHGKKCGGVWRSIVCMKSMCAS